MIACVDVHYSDPRAVCCLCYFFAWADGVAGNEYVSPIDKVASYTPGAFYQRELPCIMQVHQPFLKHIQYLTVDGYVWLNREDRPGLGAFVYHALRDTVPVIGVAKTPVSRCRGL